MAGQTYRRLTLPPSLYEAKFESAKVWRSDAFTSVSKHQKTADNLESEKAGQVPIVMVIEVKDGRDIELLSI